MFVVEDMEIESFFIRKSLSAEIRIDVCWYGILGLDK